MSTETAVKRPPGRPSHVHVEDAVRMAWAVNPRFNQLALSRKLGCHRHTVRKYVRQMEEESPEDMKKRMAARFGRAVETVIGTFARNVFEGKDDLTDAQRAGIANQLLGQDKATPIVAVQVNQNAGDDALVKIAQQRGVEVSQDFSQ